MDFNRKRFRQGVLTGAAITVSVFLFVGFIWLIFYPEGSSFPWGLVTFGSAGFMLTLAGCIGPGRYRQKYKMVLYYPKSGSAYYNKVVVSAFSADPTVREATLMANDRPIEKIQFDENGVFEKEYSIKDFHDQDVVNLKLIGPNKEESNSTLFTFYDIVDFSDEELLEIESNELQKRTLTVEEGRKKYLEEINDNLTWFSVGLLVTALIVGIFLASLI